MVALALFNKFFDPNCFDKIFFTPESSKTVLMELPAITPEPGAEGLKRTLAAPNFPTVLCGIEAEFVKGTSMIFFYHHLLLFVLMLLHHLLYQHLHQLFHFHFRLP